jgi:hypothetical protein
LQAPELIAAALGCQTACVGEPKPICECKIDFDAFASAAEVAIRGDLAGDKWWLPRHCQLS